MRLIEKIILLMAGLSLPPLVVAGTFFYYSVRSTLETQTTEHLNSIATIQKNRLEELRTQNIKRLADFTSREKLRTLLAEHNRTGSKSSQTQIIAIINEAKRLGKDIDSIVIKDPKGLVVASTESSERLKQVEEATKTNDRSVLENSFRLVNRPNTSEPIFYLNGPLALNEKNIGSVGIMISADELTNTVSDYTGLGETGEIVLARRLENGQMAFITALRFDSQAANRIISDRNLPMNNALNGEERVISSTKDYRNHNVVVATRYIDSNDWGLVVKIDRSEALQPLQRLRNEIIMLAFINSVLVVFIAIALARRVSQPILDISEVANQTAKGNLKQRARVTSKDEIGDLAITFNQMLTNLEELDKAKSDFVSVASHQLRTPLTSIKWATEELINTKKAPSQPKQKQYLEQIHASNERMIELVGALLNVSKIDVGTLPFKDEPVDLANTLDQIISDLNAMLKSKNIEIVKKVDKNLPMINIDPNWMGLILQNLLSNAVRYSPPNQTVKVGLKKVSEYITIKVEDKGYGIPKSQQANIFTKFYRADNAHALDSNGSGLGLYITKSMVERAGGSITFQSKEGKGTTFYVKLPSNIKSSA